MSDVKRLGKYRIYTNKLIGKGSSAQIYECESDDQREALVARCLELQDVWSKEQFEKEEKLIRLFQETQEKVKNVNIVKIFEILYEEQKAYIIMERCEKTLKEDIDQRFGLDPKSGQKRINLDEQFKTTPYTCEQAVDIIAQVIEGYRILINCNVIHRDIKPENILLKGGVVKITDFGASRVLPDQKNYKMTIGKCTPAFESPQMRKNQIYSSKSDIYSIGLIFYQLLTGILPFFPKNREPKFQDHENFLSMIEQSPFMIPEEYKIPQHISRLVQHMLRYYEQDRISWDELLTHPLFNRGKIIAINQASKFVQLNRSQQSKQKVLKLVKYIMFDLNFNQRQPVESVLYEQQNLKTPSNY